MKEKNKDELYVVENYHNKTIKDISNILKISPGMVQYYAKKNNLNKKFVFSDDEKQYMKDHYLNMGYKQIADYLGYTERQIRGCINHMGLTKNRKINDEYFNNIDTSEKAYYIGFIYADGWIVYNENNRNYEFGMELQSCDKYILEDLNNRLGGQNIIYHNNPKETVIDGHIAHSNHSDILRIYSKKLVLGLMNNGICTNKSQKSTFPNISDDLFSDFLRGYIDGDGCYWKYKNHYYMHITSANDSILKHIQERLDLLDIETRIYKEKDRKYRLMCVNLPSMKNLVNFLYYSDDVLCLSRKYNKIKSYLEGSAA